MDEDTVTTNDKPGAAMEEMSARDAMIKAAEAAAAESGEEDGEEKPKAPEADDNIEDEDGKLDEEEPKKKEPPKAKPKADEEPPPEKAESKLARELRARENAREIEVQAEGKMAEANTIIERAKTLFAQAQQYAQQVQEQAREIESFKKDPIAAMKKYGWTPEQFIEAATQSHDPNYKRAVTLEEKLNEERQARAKLEQTVNDLLNRAKGYEEQTAQASQQEATQRFFTAIPDDSPARRVWDDEILIAKANKAADLYYAKTKKVASPEELAHYLHGEAMKLVGASPSAPAESAGQKPQKAGKAKANGSRALSGRDASEVHGSGQKAIGDMTPEEEREYLKSVADAAMANPD
jgi:hypothetical protein